MKMSTLYRIILLIGIIQTTACKNVKSTGLTHAELKIEQKVEILLAQMTLEEKIGQMTQVRHFWDIEKGDITSKFLGSVIHTQGPLPDKEAADWQAKFRTLQEEALSTRLGIPLLFGVDAVHGQNTYNGATIFPHNIGLGATHNPTLVKRVAEITAIESQACGFNWVFSPCVAIPYNEKWGRFYEAYSEDVVLTANLSKATINGLQGALSDQKTVLATAKHFIGDGATENGQEGGVTSLDIAEIKQLLVPYQVAVREGVGAIMASFNTIDGIATHAHKAWITDTLKGSLGFTGMVISDWKGYTRFGQEKIINAGVDMVMAVDGDLDFFQSDLKNSVDSSIVSILRIDDAVRRILRQKMRLGLFENPFPNPEFIDEIGSQEHRDVARQAVRESLVLLKNKNNTLPLFRESKKIVVVGEHANNAGLQSGGWTIHWQGTDTSYLGSTTILQGIKNQSHGQVIYDSLGTEIHADADVAILVVGETPYAEFFGDIDGEMKRYQLTLTQEHQDYITNYTKQGMKVVVVLISGRPLVVSPQIEQSDAFVAAWLPGSEGAGVAEVLFGEYDFHGKLPHSWPKSVHDFNGKYGPNYWDDSITPLFPLGYGLTYTSTNNYKK
jgi:beta-glucosidase